MKFLRRLCALLVGAVFFIAGTLKLMDPVGAGLVVQEYLRFLGLRFLLPAAGVLGEAGALAEALLGSALITGVWRKGVNLAVGVLLIAFTALTALLWAKNPPMDCGCFGEAVHLTHAQSFWKNVVLLVLWGIVVLPTRDRGGARRMKKVAFALSTALLVLFAARHLWDLPSDDFTDLRPGAELMKEGEEVRGDVLLPFYDAEGEYCNDLLIDYRAMAFSVYDPEKMRPQRWERIQALRDELPRGVRPVLLVATTPGRAAELVPESLQDICYFADRRQLMTLNRSNGGAAFIQDGLIVTKWHRLDLPDHQKLEDFAAEDVTESLLSENNRDRIKLQAFLLYIFAVMLLM